MLNCKVCGVVWCGLLVNCLVVRLRGLLVGWFCSCSMVMNCCLGVCSC